MVDKQYRPRVLDHAPNGCVSGWGYGDTIKPPHADDAAANGRSKSHMRGPGGKNFNRADGLLRRF